MVRIWCYATLGLRDVLMACDLLELFMLKGPTYIRIARGENLHATSKSSYHGKTETEALAIAVGD